ncbi:hypothetical protein [Flagellimonas flava]|uniref:hypothetical protein n=1 Tax=Flagellimonas flava TaxID=570519 RepID=UPI003D65600A
MLNKKIYRYTNVELLDQIKNGSSKALVNQAQAEFDKRDLSESDLNKVEEEYVKFKAYQEKRRDEPLTKEEWFNFFFWSFLQPNSRWIKDSFSESEYERFQTHGFDKKTKQATEAKIFGFIFWFIIATVLIFFVLPKLGL